MKVRHLYEHTFLLILAFSRQGRREFTSSLQRVGKRVQRQANCRESDCEFDRQHLVDCAWRDSIRKAAFQARRVGSHAVWKGNQVSEGSGVDSRKPPVPPNLMASLDSILPIVASNRRFGLVVDFDGTISEIVSTPDEAGISPEITIALSSLASKLALVSVMSGRAASDVVQKVGIEGLLYVGNHGAEYIIDNRLDIAPNAAEGREAVSHVFNRLQATVDVSGLIWQDKGYSASVHYRLAANTDEARHALTEALRSIPEASEIEVFWGKLVLELRASHGLDKGYAIRKLVRDYNLDSVLFIGDDTTDLDALIALRELVAQGAIDGTGVVVLHEDSPEALLEAADYSLDGVAEVERFLNWLNGAIG